MGPSTRRTIVQLVVATLAILVVAAVPAAGHAQTGGAPCASADFYGQVVDNEIWLRYPPYPEGRDAQHITAGTFDLEIHDL